MANNITTATQAKKQLKTSNFIAVMIVVTVLVLLGSGYFIKNLSQSLLLNQKIIAKKTVATNTLKNDKTAAMNLSQQYSALGSQLSTVMNALPQTADFSGLTNAIEAMALNSGVQYKDVAASSAIVTATGAGTTSSSSAATLRTQGISISVSGSYGNLNRFFAALESSVRPIKVSDISITGTSAQLNASIDAITYYQSPSTFNVTTEDVK